MAAHLSDEQIIQAFHRFCVDALAQARAEGLLDDGDLERAGAWLLLHHKALVHRLPSFETLQPRAPGHAPVPAG